MLYDRKIQTFTPRRLRTEVSFRVDNAQYRYCVPDGEIKALLEKTINQICDDMGIIILEGENRKGAPTFVRIGTTKTFTRRDDEADRRDNI